MVKLSNAVCVYIHIYVYIHINIYVNAYIYICIYIYIYIHLVDCGLNSGLHTCKAGSLPLEPHF
jgi:hypothetical protein